MKVVPYFICTIQGEDDHNLDTWMRFFLNKDTNGEWEEAYDIGVDKGLDDDEALADMRKAFEMYKDAITEATKEIVPTLEEHEDPKITDKQSEWELVDTWDSNQKSGNYTAILYYSYELDKEEEEEEE